MARRPKSYHPLHRVIGELINEGLGSFCEENSFCIAYDFECERDGHKKESYNRNHRRQRIPLFCEKDKSSESVYCNVDILILFEQEKKKEIRVIIEIEESSINPTKICGKFLTSALAEYYIHKSENNKPIPMNKSVLFIQVVKADNLSAQKKEQLQKIEKSIQNILQILCRDSRKDRMVSEYKMLYGEQSEFEDGKAQGKDLVDFIKSFL